MIRLLVDSSADFTTEELKEKEIELVSLNVTLEDKTYLDGVELERNDFYEMLINTSDFPKTSQPSPEAFLKIFEDVKEKGDEIICVLLSSSLSGTCQSAQLAKNMVDYDNIFLIDSLTATHMIRMMVLHADKLRKDGVSAVEIVETMENLKSRVKVAAAVDTLEYLCRGGRVSKAAAAIGELANIKPVIQVTEDGYVAVIGKCLGKNKAMRFVIDQLKKANLDESFPLYSIYAYGTENSEKLEAKALKEGFQTTERVQIGATIGAHVGPGAFGFIFVEK